MEEDDAGFARIMEIAGLTGCKWRVAVLFITGFHAFENPEALVKKKRHV